MQERTLSFSEIAERKQYNDELVKSLKKAFDDALNLHDFTVLFKMIKEIDEEKFVMTGETSRMINLINITVHEMTGNRGHYFFEGCSKYGDLYNKYLYTIMMLRRVELYPKDSFSDEAYEFLAEERISPYAIGIILEKEYFEHRRETVISLYDFIKDKIDSNEKSNWNNVLINKF